MITVHVHVHHFDDFVIVANMCGVRKWERVRL
jgi:hypothetical protein